MRFCKREKCKWYSDPSKYGRKCYYEPRCWRGWLDIIIFVAKRRLRRGE